MSVAEAKFTLSQFAAKNGPSGKPAPVVVVAPPRPVVAQPARPAVAR